MSPRLFHLALAATPLLGLTALGTAQASKAERAQATVDISRDRASYSALDNVAAPGIQTGEASAEQVAESRKKGAAWLVQVQRADGGWGAGSWGTDDVQAPSDVATSALSILALIRDGGGVEAHKSAVTRGVSFVSRVVLDSPKDKPELNTPLQTQPQYKLGRLVDTHLAALMLGEVVGHLDEQTDILANQAYDRVLGKVQMAQKDDGSFDDNGWAPVLSSSIAASSLMRGWEMGKDVSPEVLQRNERYQAQQVDTATGSFDSSAGAGVELYSVATALKGNSEVKKRASASPGRGEAQQTAQAAEDTAVDRVMADADGRLMAGFGSAGGEEMLSYMMISDSLADADADKFASWNERVGGYLVGTQNADGSWAGHHCITSRTFVTAAAMMTLGADKASQMRAARTAGAPQTTASFAPDAGPAE